MNIHKSQLFWCEHKGYYWFWHTAKFWCELYTRYRTGFRIVWPADCVWYGCPWSLLLKRRVSLPNQVNPIGSFFLVLDVLRALLGTKTSSSFCFFRHLHVILHVTVGVASTGPRLPQVHFSRSLSSGAGHRRLPLDSFAVRHRNF